MYRSGYAMCFDGHPPPCLPVEDRQCIQLASMPSTIVPVVKQPVLRLGRQYRIISPDYVPWNMRPNR